MQGCRTPERKGYRSFRNSKARNNAEKICEYIFTIYKATNQIREAVGRNFAEAVNVKLSAIRVSGRKLSACILNLNRKSNKIQSKLSVFVVVSERAETIVKAARRGG